MQGTTQFYWQFSEVAQGRHYFDSRCSKWFFLYAIQQLILTGRGTALEKVK